MAGNQILNLEARIRIPLGSLDIMNRGPYKDSLEAYEKAIELRKIGYGYQKIGKIVGKHELTIREWVKHIPAPNAHRLYSDTLIKPIQELKSFSQIRSRLIKEKGNKCEHCLLEEWLGKPITLEIDHIDGNHDNDELQNLRLLCPNCHSYTPNWRRRKRVAVDQRKQSIG